MLAITTAATAILAFASSAFAAPAPEFAHLVARQGYIDTCFRTYSVVSGDSCNVIINKFNATFTLAEFYDWNPQVASDCHNLFPGEVVCVGLENTPSNPPACPVPVAPGLVSNCDKCYQVVDGDYCYGVAQKNNITIDQLYLWNPSLSTDCTNLQLGYNYCVGVETS
ncbi:hypothetical protein F5Y04DRAFT_282615 [Hypomontagnella monticulosa]|nr:hypothetical protein F5Y04DRAFT_282615 [Hypomontagnella monticulosa]